MSRNCFDHKIKCLKKSKEANKIPELALFFFFLILNLQIILKLILGKKINKLEVFISGCNRELKIIRKLYLNYKSKYKY